MFKTRIARSAIVALFAAVTILSNSQAGAAVVQGVTIEEVSSQQNTPPFTHLADFTIDGSGGVPTDSSTGVHNASAGAMWLNVSSDGTQGCCPFGETPISILTIYLIPALRMSCSTWAPLRISRVSAFETSTRMQEEKF
jgi:hypothetical protein